MDISHVYKSLNCAIIQVIQKTIEIGIGNYIAQRVQNSGIDV